MKNKRSTERKLRRRIRRRKNEELKQAMQRPVMPLPVQELCEYEKVRVDNIKEREEAMANSGFFEKLMETKEEMGFYKKPQKGNEEKKKIKKKTELKMDTQIKSKQKTVHDQFELVKESENKDQLKNLSAVNDNGIQVERKISNCN